MTVNRAYDIVLFGATGFTGGLTAEYLAEHAPARTRWALAGRNRRKLETVREGLTAINPACAGLPLLHADVTSARTLEAMATASRLVITTVGPYIHHGEPLVAACAAAGTDYVDLAAEPEFVDSMYVRYHAQAMTSGARIVHACGFDSIPHDLGVYFTVQRLPENVPIRVEGFVRGSGSPSGGTLHSAITALSRPRQTLRAARARHEVEPQPYGRQVRVIKGPAHFAPASGPWPLPLPTIDPLIVTRSAAVLDRYGPDFGYGHFVAIEHLPAAIGAVAGVVGLAVLAQLPPARDLLLKARRSGDGPSSNRRARSWFNVRFVGAGGGRRVVTEVSGGDPGYGETAKMLAESALCLIYDEPSTTAGQVTTAVAMGNPLIDRLCRAGIVFRVVKSSDVQTL